MNHELGELVDILERVTLNQVLVQKDGLSGVVGRVNQAISFRSFQVELVGDFTVYEEIFHDKDRLLGDVTV